jgi:Phage terminase-like protein, large subunit
MNYISEYVNKIRSGKIVTSKRVRTVYEQLLSEIEQAIKDDKTYEKTTSDKEKAKFVKKHPYRFDEDKANRPIEFVERFCKQAQGVLGAPLRLELFQKAFIQALFGFLERDTGFRRFRETLFLVARKNGKTTLLSALALYMLVADGEGAAEIYSVATKKDQAKKVLTEAVNMVKQSPALRTDLKKRRASIFFPPTASEFQALASDSNTLDGLNSHAVIIDELHAIRDRNLYEVMKQSTSSRRQPLVVMITTSGTVRESVFDGMYDIACDIADGKVSEPTFLPIIYELDDETEWTNPKMWIKANPGLGTIKQLRTLADFVQRAKNNPEDKPGVLCKDFNLKATTGKSWLPYEEVFNDATFDIKDIEDTYALGGCDLSATTDLTCATLLIRRKNDETVYVLQQYFLPQSRVDYLAEHNTNEAPYQKWADQRLLTICPGKRVDYSMVTAWFCQMRDDHKIDCIKVGYDRALAGYWVDEMERNGFKMEQVAQGPFTFSQPMREMGAALAEKKVNYNKNPILLWCLTNTGKKETGVNNIQPAKISTKLRIDGTLSLLDAWVMYVKHSEEYMYCVG